MSRELSTRILCFSKVLKKIKNVTKKVKKYLPNEGVSSILIEAYLYKETTHFLVQIVLEKVQ